MSTSIHHGLVSFAGSLSGAASDPVDTAIVRDGIANGLLHAADSFGQVRVNYCPIAPSFASNALDAFGTIEASPTTGQWYAVGGAPFGSWPLTMHAAGAVPYVLRIRIGIAASGTSGTVGHTYRVVLAPDGEALEEVDRSVDHVFEVNITASTSIGWATGASQGSIASETLLTVTAEQADDWVRLVPAYDAVSGGSPTAIDQVPISAWVFAKTTDASVLPRVHALHLTEYCGP